MSEEEKEKVNEKEEEVEQQQQQEQQKPWWTWKDTVEVIPGGGLATFIPRLVDGDSTGAAIALGGVTLDILTFGTGGHAFKLGAKMLTHHSAKFGVKTIASITSKTAATSAIKAVPLTAAKLGAKACIKSNEKNDNTDIYLFEYKHNFDKNGIVYYLNINKVQINIYTSTLIDNKVKQNGIGGYITKSINNSWIVIDFGQLLICPNAYTLQGYSIDDKEVCILLLRTWTFLGLFNLV